VDRLFPVAGFGTIATGTALGNQVNVGDNLTILPKNKKVKVRNIQRHAESVASSVQGSRVALDFVGIKREDIEVGNIIAQHEIPKTARIDARLTFIDDENNAPQFEALLFTGTCKCKVRVRVIHADIAQLELDTPWYFCINDHFILRNTSNDKTIAGGFVIDPVPVVHKRISQKLIEAILPIAGDRAAYLHYKVNESIYVLDASYFSSILQLSEENIIQIIHQSDKVICIKHHSANLIFTKKLYHDCSKVITAHINQHNLDNPLSSSGVSKEQIRNLFKDKRIYKDHLSNELALNLFLTQMEKEGLILQANNRWNIFGYEPVVNQEQQALIQTAETLIMGHGFEGMYEDELVQVPVLVIDRLVETRVVYRQDKKLFHIHRVSDVKKMLYKYLSTNANGVKVSEFRELLGTNRKVAMSYLEILEKERFIFRDGDFRFLV
ncbi:MAG: SelB C-terminal domain-containing protein, partial [Bacteroidales bacterium]|nr:SelB C-terminal domain-containing protein [Bacteroidales bacterium]